MNKLIFGLALLIIFLFAACEQKNIRDDAGRDTTVNRTQTENTSLRADTTRRVGLYWDNNKTYTYTDRKIYKRDLTAALARLDKKIDSLEAKERVATGDLRDKYDKAINDLRDKRKDIKDHVDKADLVKQDDWDDFRTDVNEAWVKVEDSWNDMVEDFRDMDNTK